MVARSLPRRQLRNVDNPLREALTAFAAAQAAQKSWKRMLETCMRFAAAQAAQKF